MKSTVASAQLSRTSPMPLYHQVAGLMRVWIKDGKWQNGDIIPSYDHLKRQFGVARVTVRDAVKLLQVERLLSPKRGIGTVVIGKNNHQRLLKLGAGMSDLLKMYEGDTPDLEAMSDVETELEFCPTHCRLAPRYRFLKRAHRRHEQRYCIIQLYIAKDVFDCANTAFREKLALPVLFALPGLKMDRAWQELTVTKADTLTADELGLGAGEPIARVKRFITRDSGDLVYYADVQYRGDAVKFNMSFEI